MKRPIFQDRRGGLLLKVMLVLAGIVAVLALCWMLFLPAIVTRVASSKTGFDVSVQRMHINPFTAYANIDGFIIRNPADFPTRDFVELQHINVDVALFSLLSGDRLVVENAAIDVPRITYVKDARGRTNFSVLQENLSSKERPAEKQPAPKAQKEFLIKHLNLKVGRVVLADYSGRTPSTREIGLNIDQTYENVTSVTQLAAPLTAKIAGAGLTNVLGTLPGTAGKVLGGGLNIATGLIKDSGKGATETFKGLLHKLEEKPKP